MSKTITDPHALSARSESLDYAGMQVRLQPLGPMLMQAIRKEVEIGLSGTDLALGLAGFLAAVIQNYVRFLPPEGQEAATLFILARLNEFAVKQ